MAANLDFQISIPQLFEELQNLNLESKLITLNYIIETYFGTKATILNFVKSQYLSCLKSYRTKFLNLGFLPPKLLLGPILTPWGPSWIFSCSNFSEGITKIIVF